MKIQIQRKGFLLLLISVFLLWSRAESIRFDLESGHTKCISEDIKSNSMTVGKYQIVNPNDGHPLPDSHKITVRVIFSVYEDFLFFIFLWNFILFVLFRFLFSPWDQLMEIELKKMFDTVQSIHDEMYYLREREEEMQLLNKATNSKMFWFSFLSILVCLSVAGLQLWHLKSFFEKKKLI
ncbi:transmembrane emp24 domain-containing protein p24delta7-like [Salvia miltiorrhiza]|uniref:transmembrane emp24 domain-containing protein p24delta7-like n=1 Tax=Salvia miltiorrhiza TaxID=226208 RepID=UPI0025AD4FAC|nr:transmembrane emp24 domain-containing protein p24delta7-like [Salvia miltiorrhiza]